MAKARKETKRRLFLVFGCLLLPGVLFLILIGGFVGASLWPSDIGVISDSYPEIEERSGRVETEGCGLTQHDIPDCADVVVEEVSEEEVAFRSRLTDKGLAELRGTLSIPVGPAIANRPGVVLIHGSGPNTRDQPVAGDLLFAFEEPFEVFRALADHLARLGLVVLRYDKRTSAAAYGADYEFDSSTFEFTDFLDDARDALDFVAGRGEVDPDRLVVVGHSQGGQFAPFAAEGDVRIAAVVMLAGSTQSFDELIVEQIERQVAAREEQLDYAPGINLAVMDMPWDSCFHQIASGSYDREAICFAGATIGAMVDYIELGRRTPAVLQGLSVPIFAVQGSADLNIDPNEIPTMVQLLEGRDAELHRIPQMGHTLTNTVTPADPPELHPEMLVRLDRFLASVRRLPEGAEEREHEPEHEPDAE